MVLGRSVTHNLLAGADGPRREHRGGALSQLHPAMVLGRSVTHNLLAGADGPRREYRGGALSQLHPAVVMRRSVTHNLLAHNGPAGFHDLMHGMSPVHVKSPFLVPTQSKSIGSEHLLDSGLGATDARYWDRWVRVLGQKLKTCYHRQLFGCPCGSERTN